MSTLRSHLIRLASQHPEFRDQILPLLKDASEDAMRGQAQATEFVGVVHDLQRTMTELLVLLGRAQRLCGSLGRTENGYFFKNWEKDATMYLKGLKLLSNSL